METLRAVDRELLLALNHLGAAGASREAVIRLVATGLMYALVGIVLYLGLARPGGRRLLGAVLGSAALSYLIGKVIAELLARERPFVALGEQVRHVELIVRPDSFPSIHSVAGFALAGAVLLGGYPRWGALMLALGLLMGSARVAAGVHWPSDVLGGAALGLAGAAAVAAIRRRRARPAEAS